MADVDVDGIRFGIFVPISLLSDLAYRPSDCMMLYSREKRFLKSSKKTERNTIKQNRES